MKSSPIGVFDSGLGGLTVVRRVREILPNESLLYVGDTARIPYGPKSPEVIREFSMEIASHLATSGVKIIVVACNTASAFGLSALTAAFDIPILGVIAPGARAAAKASKSGRIGVIGTRGTVGSEAYQNALLSIRPDLHVFSMPAPLFVPLVEEGHLDDDFARLAVRFYLEPLLAKKIDTLILGCTHYPLLEPLIHEFVGDAVTVVDSARSTAAELKNLLEERGLLAVESGREPLFFATDAPEHFAKGGERFFGRPLGHVRRLPLEELAMARRALTPALTPDPSPGGRGEKK